MDKTQIIKDEFDLYLRGYYADSSMASERISKFFDIAFNAGKNAAAPAQAEPTMCKTHFPLHAFECPACRAWAGPKRA